MFILHVFISVISLPRGLAAACDCGTPWTFLLTHTCLVDFSILMNWLSSFSILGVSGVLYHSYFITDRNSC